MKIKQSFVTNSSSTSFIIRNKTNEPKDLVDFVKENPQLIENYKNKYDFFTKEVSATLTQENLILSSIENNIIFPPDSGHVYIFGDEQGTLIGQVFDYMLRSGGESESFKWKKRESLR